jgi:di/tricarboxylate transporter
MSELQRVILIIVILVLSAVMAILQMSFKQTVPIEFWAVIYSVLGAIGIIVSAPAVKVGAQATAKRIGQMFK